MRRFAQVVLVVAALYGALIAGLAVAMRQPPDVFGSIMAKLPGLAFALLPFKALWMNARTGGLHVGDAAPDFALALMNGSSMARLSSFHGRPVVLIFGSYT